MKPGDLGGDEYVEVLIEGIKLSFFRAEICLIEDNEAL